MSLLRDLLGRGWHDWPPEDMDALSPSPPPISSSSASSITPNSSRSHSPRPGEGDDVMKLPRREMHIFGQCPVQDDFVLVVCDTCGASVKIEAFASHVKLRHHHLGSGRKKAEQRSLKSCSVDLLKEDIFSIGGNSSQHKYDRRSTSPLAGSSSCSLDLPLASRSRSKTPDEKELVVPPMVISLSSLSSSSMDVVAACPEEQQPMDVDMDNEDEEEEEADNATTNNANASGSNNVISIPDTDPLPHRMSNEMMAMLGESNSNSTPAADSTTTTTNNVVVVNNNPPPVIKLQVNNDTLILSSSNHSTTSTTTTSSTNNSGSSLVAEALKSLRPSPIKKGNSTSFATNAAAVASSGNSSGRSDRKPLREYHPDKHCGVWDGDTKRHCTRALTCKSHSVLLKRKIDGRSKPFDELVVAHKKAQAAAAAAAAAASSITATPVTTVVAPATPTIVHPISFSNGLVRGLSPVPKLTQLPPQSIVTSHHPMSPLASVGRDGDENLHYTTDHPRALAICTFGGRRVGGLIVTGRNQLLTRKLVRVAITAGGQAATMGGGGVAGFHRIKPRVLGDSHQFGGVLKRARETSPRNNVVGVASSAINSSGIGSTGSYVLNYSLSGNLKRGSVAGGPGSVNLTTLPPGGVVIPESFKTDIQDFKGGIKFELGRKIKHILPSGSEVVPK